MAGAVPLTNITRLPSHSLSCGSPACTILSSGASSLAGTQLQRRIPHHQVYNNGAFGASGEKWRPMHNSKRKERSAVVWGEVFETADTEQKQEVSPSIPSTSHIVPDLRGSWATKHPYADLEVGERWRVIQGEKDWETLLDPLDKALRGELIRYGELIQVTYDSFDYDTHSRFCGSCKYSKSRLLQKMGLENRGYEVTDYIYGTAGEGVPLAKFFKFMDPVDEDGNKEEQDAWDRESNWIGYVAVTTDPNEIKRLGRRDIVVVWRGTVTKLEWLENLRDYTTPSGLDPRQAGQPGQLDLKVEAGFLQLYKSDNARSPYTKKSARRQLLEAIIRLVRKYGDEELSITVTGHSLGSALAMIVAYDIAETGVNQVQKLPEAIAPWNEPERDWDPNQVVGWTKSDAVKTVTVTVYSFGGPRVGNDAFRDRTVELGVKVLRVVNENDMVPRLPGLWINERMDFLEKRVKWFWNWLDSLPWTYSHVGVPLYVNNMISPFLRKTKNPNNAHNLEGYLHVLTGFHAPGKKFVTAIFRDIALVNKASDFLLERHFIPSSWWQEENKGLVRTEDGLWIPGAREKVDYPEYDLDEHQQGEILHPGLSSIQ